MIALKKEVFDKIREEAKYIGLVFVLVLIIFKIAFYKEDLLVLLRNVLSIFWLFALPGYFIMLYWKERLEFLERFIIGIALSAAVMGAFSYYIGLSGINIKYHAVLLPLILILVGLLVNFFKK
ncbi:hypothetical protein HYU50_00660 [Candidatus Woesearchaeota archaeon]|nr:hypothetical protein [Candidatus Woesearchaeota archaeon]